MKAQNTTHAVMAQRYDDEGALDDFPTPPWAVRALFEHVLDKTDLRQMSVWEPAVGRGHMIRVFQEYFGVCSGSDIADYGAGYPVFNFLKAQATHQVQPDWIITNPPFSQAEAFIHTGLKMAREGVAVLVRSVFLEGVGRYTNLYKNRPPTILAPFVERVPMVRGRLSARASTATAYSWMIWDAADRGMLAMPPDVVWIPPCRKDLEKPSDYEGVDSPSKKEHLGDGSTHSRALIREEIA